MRELGEYRDSVLTMEALARATGPILESAVQELMNVHAKFFRQKGPDLVHVVDGSTIEEWVADLRTKKPHYFADYMPATDEQILAEIIDEATLRPTPKAVGRLFKEVGELRAKEILKQAGTDWVRMKPGTKLKLLADGKSTEEEVPRKEGKKNPWSKEFWNVTAQGSVVKAMGIEKAQQIARAAGSYIGATRPAK
jgi:hypothetical protein